MCGDGVCEEEELCSTCPADCSECPMSPTTQLSIGLPLGLLCLCFVLTAVVRTPSSKVASVSHGEKQLSVHVSPLVDEVPETEAPVGRELDR